jgi:hypothetical protein
MRASLLPLFLCLPLLAQSDSRLVKGLTYYLAFDGGFTPTVAAGSRAVAGDKALAPGRLGQGAVVHSQSISMNHRGNYDSRRGTVAFWVKPDWNGSDQPAKGGARGFFRGGWVALNYITDKRVCFFMTGDVKPPEGFRWDYGQTTTAMREWQAGTWHHLAISWDATTKHKAIYVDGQVAFDGLGTVLSDKEHSQLTVTLGNALATGTYDEWAIWDRELAPKEVAEVFARPEELARLAAAMPQERQPGTCPLSFEIPVWDPPAAAILEPGMGFRAKIAVRNRSEKAYRATLRADLVDIRDHVLAGFSVPVDFEPEQQGELALDFAPPDALGVFKVAVTVPGAEETWVRDVTSFAVWPKPTQPPRRDSYFGNHVNSWYGGKMLDQAARLGLGWMRNHDMLQTTWWNRVQPEPGEPQWQLSECLQYCLDRKMPVLGGLTGTPYWAVKGGARPKVTGSRGYTLAPDPDLWREYVRMTVTRYKDDIREWEIWNEPAVSMFFTGTPEEHAELIRIASEEIHRIDPNLIAMASGYTTPAWRWHEATAKAGGWRDLDVLSMHYGCPNLPPEESQRKLREILDHFRGLLKQYGPDREVPIWSTEGGTGDTIWLRGVELPELPPEHLRQRENARHGACRVVQGEAILMANGIPKHFYYFQNPIRKGSSAYLNTSMFDYNLAPRPKLMARVAMQRELDGAAWTGEVSRPADGRFWAHLFAREDGGTTVLWWAGDGGKLSVRTNWPGERPQAVDLMGNVSPAPPSCELTDEPAYVRLNAGPAAVRAALEQADVRVIRSPEPLPIAEGEGLGKPEVPPLPDFVAPGENPAGVFTIDLREVCNMGFADPKAGDGQGGWSDEGPMNDLREMPLGRQTFAGVPFEIVDPASNGGKSVVTLRGRGVTPTLPKTVRIPLPKARNIRCLYFLHAAAWGTPGEIGSYTVHYADGTTAEIANRIPESNGNWWNGHDPKETSHPVPLRVTNTLSGKPVWRYLRILEWQNPKRTVPVTAVEAVSKGGQQTPILIALTGV